MRLAYADPPYIGQAKRHYGGVEVDHYELVRQLSEYDGWALSLGSTTLEEVLLICREVLGPNQVRIAAWVKPFHVYKKGVRPAYAWEPVIFRGGHNPPAYPHPPPPKKGMQNTPKDFIAENITLRKGLVGAKPPRFCWWLFDLLGAKVDDTLDDLFPGTGIVTRCWEQFVKEHRRAT